MFTTTDYRGSAVRARRAKTLVAFALLWLLYQSAEGIGERWLHSFGVQAGLMCACVLAAWPLSRWLGYRGYGAYALTARGWQSWLPGVLLLAVLAKFSSVYLGLQLGLYALRASAITGPDTALALASALPMLLISTFVPSLAEDVITRGFWYRAAGIRWRAGTAFVLASSTIYVLNHIYRLQNGPLEWLMLFSFGLTYATALWRTGSLWAALGLHWGWNLGNGILTASVSMQVRDPDATTWLSVSAHLVMLAVVCALPRRRPAPSLVGD